jgi:hypothetical protein
VTPTTNERRSAGICGIDAYHFALRRKTSGKQAKAIPSLVKLNAVPVVVGVAGLSTIAREAQPQLQRRFGEIVEQLSRSYPATPLLLLCGLGGDADRVAAAEAAARSIEVMDVSRVPGLAASSDVPTFIAYYSTVLVAFWSDGPPGDTETCANVLRLRETGVRLSGSKWSATYEPDIGPVFQIVTPRDGQAPRDAFAVREIYPDYAGLNLKTAKRLDRKEEFETALRNLDRFNRDLLEEPSAQGQDGLAAFRDRADSASNRLQKATLRSLRGLYVVAAIAGAAQLAVQPPLPVPSAIGAGVRLGALAVAFLWLKVAKREDYENRYQDYRAIAEALRVQHAWCDAGLRDRLVEGSYLQMQQNELQWIRLALRSIYLISNAGVPKSGDSPNGAVCRSWLEEQRRYYERAARVQEENRQRANRVASILLGIGGALSGIAVAVSLLVGGLPSTVGFGAFHLHLLPHPWALNLGPHKVVTAWLAYLMTVPAALAGIFALLMQFYVQQRGYTENSRRYQRMFVVFDTANRRLQERVGDASEVLAELGHEALSEHADWLILHRERPLRNVTGLASVQGGQRH